MHNISLIFRSSVWDPAGATSSKVYKRLGLQQVHTQRPEILQSLFKCPANSWSCWLLLPGSWSQLQFSASPVCLFSLPWDLNSLMELSCWFSVCSVFLCCEGRSDDLQALFMLEMKLEVSPCIYKGTMCNHRNPADASLQPPGGRREMPMTGPRFLTGDVPSTLLPSWPGRGMRTEYHEHCSKWCSSQADYNIGAVGKSFSGHNSIPVVPQLSKHRP